MVVPLTYSKDRGYVNGEGPAGDLRVGCGVLQTKKAAVAVFSA